MKRLIILSIIFLFLVIFLTSGISSVDFSNEPIATPIVIKIVVDDYKKGTGFFIEDNLIFTAGHCLRSADKIKVVWKNGDSQYADAWYIPDFYTDVGIIEVDTNDIEAKAIFANPVLKEDVWIEGNPLNIFPYVTKGIISAVFEDKLFTDAAVNPGNSGSPVLNNKKEVIGLVTKTYTYLDGLGIAVPSDKCLDVIKKYKIFKSDDLEKLAKHYIEN